MYQPTVHLHHELDERARAVTTLIGEVDAATAPEVSRYLDRLALRPDVVDCRFVTFMGAAGLDALVAASRVQPFVTVASAAVERVARLCGLEDVLRLRSASGPPVLHHSRLAVAQHDEQLRYMYVNDALAGLDGLPAQAHYGRRAEQLFDVAHDELTPVLQEVAATRTSRRILVEGDTPAGRATWLCAYHPVRYRSDSGMVSGVVAAVAEERADSRRRDPVARLDFGLRGGR